MRRIAFMLALFAALPAIAQAQTEFTYHAMLKQLRGSGIDPAQVAWAEVRPLCTGFMSYNDDQTEYNQCLFDKATLAVSFATDRETCDIESLATSPDSVRRQPQAIIGTVNSDGTSTVSTITTPRITRSELRTERAATYNSCMRDAGWRNPRNWRLGYAN